MAPSGIELTCRGAIDSAAPNNDEKLRAHFALIHQTLEAVHADKVSFGTKCSVVDATKRMAGWLGGLDLHPTRKVFLQAEPVEGQLKPICDHLWSPLVALRNDLSEAQHSDDDLVSLEGKMLLLRVNLALKAVCTAVNAIPGQSKVCVCKQHTELGELEDLETFMARKD